MTPTASVLSDGLDEVLAESRRLRYRFASTAARPWDAVTAAAELCVQIGHLARCLQHRSGHPLVDDPQRPITNVGDELADVVLAACSIAVLTGSTPAAASSPAPTAARGIAETDVLLRLLANAGALAESTMVALRYRHQPTGAPETVAGATADVLADCDTLAELLGLDLLAEFRAMVADADAFLDAQGGAR